MTRVKPIDSFSARWDSIVDRVLAAPQRQQQQQPATEALGDSGAGQEGEQGSTSSISNGSPRECEACEVHSSWACCVTGRIRPFGASGVGSQ